MACSAKNALSAETRAKCYIQTNGRRLKVSRRLLWLAGLLGTDRDLIEQYAAAHSALRTPVEPPSASTSLRRPGESPRSRAEQLKVEHDELCDELGLHHRSLRIAQARLNAPRTDPPTANLNLLQLGFVAILVGAGLVGETLMHLPVALESFRVDAQDLAFNEPYVVAGVAMTAIGPSTLTILSSHLLVSASSVNGDRRLVLFIITTLFLALVRTPSIGSMHWPHALMVLGQSWTVVAGVGLFTAIPVHFLLQEGGRTLAHRAHLREERELQARLAADVRRVQNRILVLAEFLPRLEEAHARELTGQRVENIRRQQLMQFRTHRDRLQVAVLLRLHEVARDAPARVGSAMKSIAMSPITATALVTTSLIRIATDAGVSIGDGVRAVRASFPDRRSSPSPEPSRSSSQQDRP